MKMGRANVAEAVQSFYTMGASTTPAQQHSMVTGSAAGATRQWQKELYNAVAYQLCLQVMCS